MRIESVYKNTNILPYTSAQKSTVKVGISKVVIKSLGNILLNTFFF